MARRQRSINSVRVEMAVSCMNLVQRDRFARSVDPLCILYVKSRGSRQWKEVGRTERIHNTLNPEWTQTMVLDYYFEEKQCLKFAIFDWSKPSQEHQDQDTMGNMECTLAEVIAASSKGKFERGLSPYRQQLGDAGVVSIYAEEHTGLKDTITFEFTGSNLDKKDLFSESDPFFTLSRLNPDGSDTIVYRSDYLKDEPNPSWPAVTITSDKLCNGDWNRRLRVQIYDYNDDGDHDYIGEFYTNLEELAEGEGFQIVTWDVINEKKKNKKDYENSGTVILKSIKIDQDTTFLDYIRGGLKLHFVVAIDFTTSNGMPNDPNSLHYLDRQRIENPYTMAIRSVGEIFQDYDLEKRFLALGFGGQVNGRVSHCFPLNGNSRDPYCRGIQGVIDAYYESLEHVPLSDPTCYAPVIDYVRSMAETMQDGQNYVVLLIITDGGISDMEQTKRTLIHTANTLLPMSLIIVGVGKGDMSEMNILDADNKSLSLRGIRAKRDIVQFVELSKYIPEGRLDPMTFQNMMEAANMNYYLAKDVLAEVPHQVAEYMERNGFRPRIPDVQTALQDFDKMRLSCA